CTHWIHGWSHAGIRAKKIIKDAPSAPFRNRPHQLSTRQISRNSFRSFPKPCQSSSILPLKTPNSVCGLLTWSKIPLKSIKWHIICVSKVDHNLQKSQGSVRLTYLYHPSCSQVFSVSAMNITYLSACLMLIGTIVGNSNASTSGPSKPITVCGGVEEIFKDGKCPTNGCKTVVEDGQYKLKCTNIHCRKINCTKSQWSSTGEVCYGCKNGLYIVELFIATTRVQLQEADEHPTSFRVCNFDRNPVHGTINSF
ncbi:hypothetical protein MJO29_005047, partial [Puccinia striiformis f. sp. tritici]